jgi:hypothetical protein
VVSHPSIVTRPSTIARVRSLSLQAKVTRMVGMRGFRRERLLSMAAPRAAAKLELSN